MGTVENIYVVDNGGFTRGLWGPSLDCNFINRLYYKLYMLYMFYMFFIQL